MNDNWGKAGERNMDSKVKVDGASEQVDVGRLKRKRQRAGQGASCSREVT